MIIYISEAALSDRTSGISLNRRPILVVCNDASQSQNNPALSHRRCYCIVVTAGMVLGIGLIPWAILVLTLTVVLVAEMFYSVLKSILHNIEHHFPKPTQQAIHMGRAAVFLTNLGAVITIGLIFGGRLVQIFSG